MKSAGHALVTVVVIVMAALKLCAASYIVPDSIAGRYENRRLTDIEGVWVWSSGATIAVEAADGANISLILLDSPDPAVVVPQTMGTGHIAGNGKGYDVDIRSKIDNATGRLTSSTEKCIVSVDADGVMSIQPYSTRYRLNLWRFMPYLFRYSISKDKAPDGVNGAVRIYPQSPNRLLPPTL